MILTTQPDLGMIRVNHYTPMCVNNEKGSVELIAAPSNDDATDPFDSARNHLQPRASARKETGSWQQI
jgi:hypothetical protein